MSFDLSHYRDLYFSEAHEQLDLIAEGLRKLESAPDDRAAIEATFRAAHTLKGMSATMGYDDLTASAHALEDLLDKIRSGSGESPPNIRVLFHALDDLTSLTARFESIDPLKPDGSALAAKKPRAEPLTPLAPGAEERAPSGFAPFVRVGVQPLDQLTNLIALLVVSCNQLARNYSLGSAELESQLRYHTRLISSLQTTARQMRMATIGDLFNRYPRVLQEMARDQGKEIRVTIEGEDVELARAMMDELNEPLLHLLRNAVTHGIETRSERAAAGKDLTGLISLRARQMEERITIEVSDDGHGLNAEQISEAALEQGFISAEQRSRLNRAEALNLIMIPGFSLASTVTQASGRGVGMDAVNFKVQSLHGTVSIHSEAGQGTTFTLEVPRILGPLEADLVRVGDQVYALPSARIVRSLTVSREDLPRLAAGDLDSLLPPLRVLDLKSLLPALSPALAAPARNNHILESASTGPGTRPGARARPAQPLAYGAALQDEPTRDKPQAEYGILIMNSPDRIALRVDELLGKVLLTRPVGEAPGSRDDEPAISFLEFDQLLST